MQAKKEMEAAQSAGDPAGEQYNDHVNININMCNNDEYAERASKPNDLMIVLHVVLSLHKPLIPELTSRIAHLF